MPWFNSIGQALTNQTASTTSTSWWGSAINNNGYTSTVTSTISTASTMGTAVYWIQENQGLIYYTQQAQSLLWSDQTSSPWQQQMGIPAVVERFADVVAARELRQRVRQAARANLAAPPVLRRHEPTLQERRANDLLVSMLTDEQRQSYEQHGWFIVVGGSTGRRYRIRCNSYQGNVDLLAANDNNRIEYRYCGHCRDRIPLGDHLLAQKVMLEIDETAFIALANRSAA